MNREYPFIVIDQNVLRDSKALAGALDRCCRDSLQLLVPDVAGFELSKGSRPLDTWRRSLDYLSAFPEFVSVSRKLTKMLAEERRTGRPCETLLDDHGTTELRAMLNKLASGDESALETLINGPVRELIPGSVDAWSDSESHKAWIKTMRDGLRDTMSPEDLKSLRRNPEEGLIVWWSSIAGTRFVFQGMQSRGQTAETPLRLSSVPSVTGSFIAAVGGLGMYWLASGGLDAAAPEKATSDWLDVEYAALGSLCVDLLSNDKRLNTVCGAIRTASRNRHSWLQAHGAASLR
ncbi:MAG: hypothetical protein ACYTG0_38540 [Planctomycetota bacterium]|jgi:hypothetical protein